MHITIYTGTCGYSGEFIGSRLETGHGDRTEYVEVIGEDTDGNSPLGEEPEAVVEIRGSVFGFFFQKDIVGIKGTKSAVCAEDKDTGLKFRISRFGVVDHIVVE